MTTAEMIATMLRNQNPDATPEQMVEVALQFAMRLRREHSDRAIDADEAALTFARTPEERTKMATFLADYADLVNATRKFSVEGRV